MYDIIIIGGGPAGLSAAIYTSRALKKTLIIEEANYGGQITQALEVENYPGYENISGMELGQKMYDQAIRLGAKSIHGTVSKIAKDQDIFNVTVNKEEYQSKVVIYAAGASPKKLEIEKENKYLGSGLSYCATCDGAFFKEKTVCIVGGGNTAIDDAIYLANICKKIYMIHRRDSFRAEPIKVSMLKEKDNVDFITPATVKEIQGDNKVEKIVINHENKKETLEVDGIFVAIGRVPNTDLIKELVPLNDNGYVITNHELETSLPGFYDVGDVREKRIRQLTTATSDGTIAAISACEYLETL